MDVKDGITLELCAGIIDKAKTPREIARMEILEECGYNVPLEKVEEVQNVLGSVGNSGGTLFMHYARVNDKVWLLTQFYPVCFYIKQSLIFLQGK